MLQVLTQYVYNEEKTCVTLLFYHLNTTTILLLIIITTTKNAKLFRLFWINPDKVVCVQILFKNIKKSTHIIIQCREREKKIVDDDVISKTLFH